MEKAVDLAKQHGPYYYAHAAKAWEVPEDAKTISGEGLTHAGRGPRRLDGAAAAADDAPDDQSMEGLRQGWRASSSARRRRASGGRRRCRSKSTPSPTAGTCKIYIEFAAGELRARRTEGQVGGALSGSGSRGSSNARCASSSSCRTPQETTPGNS